MASTERVSLLYALLAPLALLPPLPPLLCSALVKEAEGGDEKAAQLIANLVNKAGQGFFL